MNEMLCFEKSVSKCEIRSLLEEAEFDMSCRMCILKSKMYSNVNLYSPFLKTTCKLSILVFVSNRLTLLIDLLYNFMNISEKILLDSFH